MVRTFLPIVRVVVPGAVARNISLIEAVTRGSPDTIA